MTKYGAMIRLVAALLLFVGKAQAEEKEPSAVVEIGGAGEWGLRDGGSSFGPSAAVEVTPIKDWLEIEAGIAPLFGGGHTEWDTDLLFKKPFTLSDTVEFMVGVDRNGRTRRAARENLPVRSRSISCSGRRRNESLVGFWNRATATPSVVGMNNRLA